jgi:hypothetical protein
LPVYLEKIDECPCGEYKMTIKYESNHKHKDNLYCPFCSIELEEKKLNDTEEDEE